MSLQNVKVPFIVECPEAKVVSFNMGTAKNGTNYFTFGIKCSANNMIVNCTIFDDISEEEKKKPENQRTHTALYRKGLAIQKGAYYFVRGELNEKLRKDGGIEPCLKVTDIYYCHDEITGSTTNSNNSYAEYKPKPDNRKPISFSSGFGR